MKKINLFKKSFFNLPNILTALRILLAILTTVLLALGVPGVLVGSLFCLAAITDKIDGTLARKFNCVTNLGKSGDALGDKILVTPVLVVMAIQGLIPLIIPYLTFFRDSIVGIVKETAGKKKGTIGASNLGKAKTATTMIGMAGILLGLPGILNIISYAFLYTGTGLCVLSGIQYVNNYKDILLEKEGTKQEESSEIEKEDESYNKKINNSKKNKAQFYLEENNFQFIDSKPKVLTYGPKKIKHK